MSETLIHVPQMQALPSMVCELKGIRSSPGTLVIVFPSLPIGILSENNPDFRITQPLFFFSKLAHRSSRPLGCSIDHLHHPKPLTVLRAQAGIVG